MGKMEDYVKILRVYLLRTYVVHTTGPEAHSRFTFLLSRFHGISVFARTRSRVQDII